MSAHGLGGAAATKLWLAVLCGGTAVALAGGGARWGLGRAVRVAPQLARDWQAWRLAAAQVAFPTAREAALGAAAVYRLRALERRLGTRRFAAFVFVCSAVGLALLLPALLLLARTASPRVAAATGVVAAGPFTLLAACAHQLLALTPPPAASAPRALAVPDRWLPAALVAVLVAARLPSALAPAAAGVAASAVYSADVAGLARWRFPRPVEAAARRWLQPLLVARRRISPAGSASPSGAALLDEATLAGLAEMFPAAGRARVQQALAAAHGDADRAAAILLDSAA
ncbi:hypothetical protein H4R18_005205 [Coemansia javaensis]|uniref:CUE domain-containing protein n=1 Tax=Coemansia javaensis TaxID=2761396 RepID=A0A9W8LDQ4_9FUNG|nr:hypothetical protein H4R18_005205 [Coemansia javaensis]